MLSVVCWKWKGTREYEAVHVNTLRQMVADHYPDPHRFICVTDDADGLDPRIEVVPLPAFDHLPVKKGSPSCYVRLWAFSKEARQHLGERFVSLDIDVVITGDLRPLFNRTEEFVAWSDPTGPQFRYQGGFYIMTAGTRAFVWDDFKGSESQAITQAAGLNGTDQAWMSYRMGDEASVDRDDGIWKARELGRTPLAKTRIVQLYGSGPPWSDLGRRRYPALCKIWTMASIRAKGDDVYVNSRNFYDGKVLRRINEVNEAPKREHIQRGLVREIKIVAPEVKALEQPDVAPRQRKRKSAKSA